MTAVTDVDMQLHVLITQNVNNLMFFSAAQCTLKAVLHHPLRLDDTTVSTVENVKQD